MTISVLVVDDEAVARQRVVRLLQERADVTVVGEASGGDQAVAAIGSYRPDVVFLDVQMPGRDGFGVLEALGDGPLPAVVFVTAFDRYALRAFEVHAVDYVLKPYVPERLGEALDRAIERLRARPDADDARLRALVRDVLARELAAAPDARPGGTLQRITIRDEGRLHVVRAADVDWLESDGNYVWLHAGAARHMVRATMARLDEQLDRRQFGRIHRRYIVNLDRVREVQPWFGGDWIVLLRDGTQLRMSRNYRDAFYERLTGVRGDAPADSGADADE